MCKRATACLFLAGLAAALSPGVADAAAAPPRLSAAFGAAAIPFGGSTSLTFTVENPNSSQALTGVGFTATLSPGLTVATPSGAGTTCGPGTVEAQAGTRTIGLSGGTVVAGGSCTLAVRVEGTSTGSKTASTGNVSSLEAGSGGPAQASLNVAGAPTVSIISPAQGTRYAKGSRLAVTFACGPGEAGAPVTGCRGTQASGSRIDTSRTGNRTFTVTAVAADGQRTVRSVRYAIVTPARPSNRFVIRRLAASRGGSVLLSVSVPADGRLTARVSAGDVTFASATRRTAGAQRMSLTLRPGARGRGLLARRGSLRARVSVSFRPVGGVTRTRTYTVRLGR